MDIYDYIATNRMEWSIYLKRIMSDISDRQIRFGLQQIDMCIYAPRADKCVDTHGPAIYIIGGSAFLLYGAFNHLRIKGLYGNLMTDHVSPTYDWDVVVNLQQMFTPHQEADMDTLFEHHLLEFKTVHPKNHVRYTKRKDVGQDGEPYLNYFVILKYEGVDYNIFEFSFKTCHPNIQKIITLPIFLGQLYLVPDVLSLLRLSLLSLQNRAPIKLYIKDRPVKNRNYFKCIQDVQRIQYVLTHLTEFPAVLRPSPESLHVFVSAFAKLVAKYPYCMSTSVFEGTTKKLSGPKLHALKERLWLDHHYDPEDGLHYYDAQPYS